MQRTNSRSNRVSRECDALTLYNPNLHNSQHVLSRRILLPYQQRRLQQTSAGPKYEATSFVDTSRDFDSNTEEYINDVSALAICSCATLCAPTRSLQIGNLETQGETRSARSIFLLCCVPLQVGIPAFACTTSRGCSEAFALFPSQVCGRCLPRWLRPRYPRTLTCISVILAGASQPSEPLLKLLPTYR